jgi:hypothetical protein
MSKMACLCGSVISNTACPCPTEGWILRDQDQQTYFDRASRDVAAFFAAVQSGRRDLWIAELFSTLYPTEVSDAEIVYDILTFHQQKLFLSIAECALCGRVWIQRDPSVNIYCSYCPDDKEYAAMPRSDPDKHSTPAVE